MIESITISSTATFGPSSQALSGLSQFNFFFGSNGTGKTTVSRIIADEGTFPTCKVTWKAGTQLQALVYNRDFVDRNFNQSTDLKGVFTLGEKRLDTLAKIASAKAELDTLTRTTETLSHTLQGADGLGGKKGELTALEAKFKEKCWAQKQKHDAKLQRAFEGYRNNSDKFKSKVLQECETNTASLLPQAELEERAESIFGQTPTAEPIIQAIDIAKLIGHGSNPILKKRVLGKEDVAIAAIINKLGNSDWVREGRRYYEANDQLCPFCQQKTTESLAKNLNEYFDESFLRDSKAIDDLYTDYVTDAMRIQQRIATTIASPSKFLDVEKLKAEATILDSKITINKQHLAAKKKEPSQSVELESLTNVCSGIGSLIDHANGHATNHNKMVANLQTERETLTAQVWRFVLEELKADLEAFKATRRSLEKAVGSINEQIKKATEDKLKKAAEIWLLERQTTSIQPTIDSINALLSSFGFQGFRLAKAASGTSYKLVRSDGADAKTTLSEGEKTFVTFLYFYHLLKGSESESGMTSDRVVVFDDPISSLDSDVLFIVSSLIKGLFEDVRVGPTHIKQIFVLTHNVYFHKEVTYNPKRRRAVLDEETFWVVRKPDLESKIEKHSSNPIKTSYELLWGEVRKPERSNIALQNILRRILENYFKILGGIDFDQLCALFEGKEKIICQSLCSWVHDGSHYAHDDLYVAIDDSTVDAYLKVFRAIFEKSGHGAHYRMMMGEDFVEPRRSPRQRDARN